MYSMIISSHFIACIAQLISCPVIYACLMPFQNHACIIDASLTVYCLCMLVCLSVCLCTHAESILPTFSW